MGERQNSDRPGFAAALRAELDAVLATPIFERSPVLSQLLSYLARITLDGDKEVTSYALATEGLGRDTDFDAKSDSYPRVQILRLRKALEDHYSHFGPLADLCIYIKPGSYRLRLAKKAIAYPHLAGTGTAQAAHTPVIADDAADPGPTGDVDRLETPSGRSRAKRHFGLWAAVIAGLTLGLVAEFFVGGVERLWQGRDLTLPPVIEVRIDAGQDPELIKHARPLSAAVTQALTESIIGEVRQVGGQSASPTTRAANYRLDIELLNGPEKAPMLFAQVTDLSSDTLIVSRRYPLVESPTGSDYDIGPLVYQIGGSYGAITATDSQRLAHNARRGYPCVLRFLQFAKTNDPELRRPLQRCITVESSEPRVEQLRLGMMALGLIRSTPLKDRPAIYSRAQALTQKALLIDNDNPIALMLAARVAFLSGDCVTGEAHAARALKIGVYEPVQLGTNSSLAAICGSKLAPTMLDQALRLEGESAANVRLALLVSGIVQKRGSLVAAMMKQSDLSSGDRNTPTGLLDHALVQTELGSRDEARKAWSRFRQSLPDANNDRERLMNFIFSDKICSAVLQYLESRNIDVSGR